METVLSYVHGGGLQAAPWLYKRQRKMRPGTGRKHQNTEFYHFLSPLWSPRFPGMLLWQTGSPGPAVDGTGWGLLSLALRSVLDRLPPSPTRGPREMSKVRTSQKLEACLLALTQASFHGVRAKLLTGTSQAEGHRMVLALRLYG